MKLNRAAVGIAAAALVSLVSPTVAMSFPNADDPAGLPRLSASASDDGTTEVTLITGDVVSVIDPEAEEPTYVVTPVPGAERDGVTFAVTRTPASTYVVPSDVAELVGPDSVLDLELFNVERMVAEGLDDAASASLPVIVQRSDGDEPTGIPGLDTDAELEVLDAYSGTVDKEAADEIGRSLTGAGTRTVREGSTASDDGMAPSVELSDTEAHLDGVSRVWLDGSVYAQDWDANLTQVGAPPLWEDGVTGEGVSVAVLDSGIDLTHPDLADQVIDSANFSSAPALDDVVGHGTHVAGTIAGTGALASGDRQGVAPDADLLIGKVLGDDGRGSMSASIAGMEWAVAEGAKIVNMSLGSAPSDGTDPVSLALDELSADSGALFVVAAGNDGPSPSTVSAPSTADRALSVAAVDATGTVAPFSSRGPRVGDDGIKPEIAAPGVSIVAPRSSMMPGPDEPYTTASGTSMATPHVAGVAALLAEERGEWDADQMKAALVGTAASATGGVRAVGAGQVYAPAALEAMLLPDEAKIEMSLSGEDTVTTEDVVVTNTGDAPVTADVSVTGANEGVSASPAAFDLAPGASRTITVTADGASLPANPMVTGAVRIVPDTGSTLNLPVAVSRARWLAVDAVTTTGENAAGATVTVLHHGTGEHGLVTTSGDGVANIRLSPGAVAVTGTIQEQTADGGLISSVVSVDVPDGVDEVTLDAATAVPIGAEVRDKTREEFGLYQVTRINHETDTGTYNSIMAGGAYGPWDRGALRVAPTTDQVPEGTLRLDEHWVLANRDSDNRVGDAHTVYDLVYSSPTVAVDPVHRLSNTDIKTLARTEIDFYAPGEPHRSQFGTTAAGPDLRGLNTISPSAVATPGHQTRYFTAGDVTWRHLGYRSTLTPDGTLSMTLDPSVEEYEPGERSATSFWGGPIGAAATVGLAADTDGTARLAGSFDGIVDAGGHTGNYGEYVVPQRGRTVTTIHRDGEQIGTSLPSAGLPVDPAAAPYVLERSYHSDDVFWIGGNTSTRWETEPVGLGDADEVALPLLQARWQSPDLDLSNTAKAGTRLRLDVSLASLALDEADRTVLFAIGEFTTDGGQTWQSMRPKLGHPRDAWRFTIPGSALASGDWAGVRVTARDRAGNTIEQEILRAFPVR